mgnify:FL=1
MKKVFSTILVVAILLSMTISAYATEVSDHSLEEMSVPEAMSNAEIVNFLISTGEIDEFYQAQEEIRNCQYETTATYAREAFGFDSISSMEVNTLTEKYNLQLPLESGNGFIDNGTINVQRNLLGDIVDIWYIFGVVSPSAFSVKVAMVDSDNPLDSITGTITRYYLGTTRWVRKDSESFSKTAVTNGTVYTWRCKMACQRKVRIQY